MRCELSVLEILFLSTCELGSTDEASASLLSSLSLHLAILAELLYRYAACVLGLAHLRQAGGILLSPLTTCARQQSSMKESRIRNPRIMVQCCLWGSLLAMQSKRRVHHGVSAESAVALTLLQPVAVLISPLQRARSAVRIATTWISVSAAAIAIPAVVPMAVRQGRR